MQPLIPDLPLDELGAKMMTKILLVVAIALIGVFLGWSQTRQKEESPLEGTWELVSGQPLPKGVKDIKIISGGHFIFVTYDPETGKPLYTGGGTYILNGSSYTEHMDFASDRIAAGLVGKDQPFTVKIERATFTQTGTLSNGKPLSETWKRME